MQRHARNKTEKACVRFTDLATVTLPSANNRCLGLVSYEPFAALFGSEATHNASNALHSPTEEN